MSKHTKIGLFGFGCVGQGFYNILAHSDLPAEVKKIGVIHPGKERTLSEELFTYHSEDILSDDEIGLIVEAITDHEEAFHITKMALQKGIPVVTANKKMVATYLPELMALQDKHSTPLLYEASCCGAIPVVRTLEDYYGYEPLSELSGIFNGSSNYILSKMREEGLSYQEAVKEAQELGFAEADPTLDVGGYDSLNKLCILTAQAFGTVIHPDTPFRHGIQNLRSIDLEVAGKVNTRLKLVADVQYSEGKGLTAFVAPVFVPYGRDLYGVENEYNAIHVEGRYSDKQLFRGKGAGSHPTGAAVFADVQAMLSGYRYAYAKRKNGQDLPLTSDSLLSVLIRSHNGNEIGFPAAVKTVASTEEGTYYCGNVTLEWLKENERLLEEKQAFLAIIPDVKNLKEEIIQAIRNDVIETV